MNTMADDKTRMTSRPRVLLTLDIHAELQVELARHCEVVVAPDASAETIARLIVNADGLMVRNQLAPDVFEHAPRLRAVVRHGVGLDMIPVSAATARGIPVANLPGSNTIAVVEYCVAAMMHLRRGLATMDRTMRESGWSVARPLAERGVEVSRGVCGIIGVGAVGSQLALVARGLGMRVIGLSRRPALLPGHVEAVGKQQLFEQADVVMLCCPLNDETRGMVDAHAVAMMKPDALLINASRGPVVNTQAVLAALREGRLGGAAFDVHDQQPLTGQESVFEAPRLLLTPHVAGITATSLYAMSRGAIDTMLALLNGERPPNVVNPEVFAPA